MKKLFLKKNPEVFQGEKYLKTNKDYFEGWYFKNTNKKDGISFIPGISITKDEKKAFIQIITNDYSYFVDYNIKDFEFNYEPFYIKIKNNFFSKNMIHIDIYDDNNDLRVYGNIKYSKKRNIETNLLNPNIMGIFSYLPFMECNHAILLMRGKANGIIEINDEKIIFNNDCCYIEKDYGCSFPKYYIWGQANSFKKTDAAFMISVANIPFKVLEFRGFICSLMTENKEYRFATYNNAKIVKYDIRNDGFNLILKKGAYYLIVDAESTIDNSLNLIAPSNGKMEKDILETINGTITVTLKKNDLVIFSDTSSNCGLEIVYDGIEKNL